MKLTREQAKSFMGGGNSFFKLEEGKSALIRFLIDTMDDLEILAAHSVLGSGQRYPTDILCGREEMDSPISDCKYCSQGLNVVGRCIIPLYNEDTKEVQYWVRSPQFISKLEAQTEAYNGQQPIAGQVFKIIRTGSGTSTNYELIAQQGNDGKTKSSFGDIKTNEDLKMIKAVDYEFPVQQNNAFANNQNNVFGNSQNNTFGNNQNSAFGNNNYTSTRRTTDMF